MAALPRSPTGWLLIPLLAGYLIADSLPNRPGLFAFCGLGFSLLALIAAFSNWPRMRWIWAVFLFGGGSLLAAGYLQLRLYPPSDWIELPPREAQMTISIQRLLPSSTAGDRVHGFAVIRETESHLAELTGSKIYFSAAPREENELWPIGTKLPATGILQVLPKNPDTDFGNFLRRSGALFEYRSVTLRGDPVPGRGFFAFCENRNRQLERFLRAGASNENSMADVYVAMLLGKRSTLDADQEQAFLITGTIHLFAISGLHIGVIAFAIHSTLALLRIPMKPAAFIGLSILLVFVCTIGSPPSAVRAFLMVSFFWGSRFCVRGPNSVAALANSALLVLLIYPGQLWSPGFQLSYSVVSGILFLGLPLGQHLQEKWTPFSEIPEEMLGLFQRGIAKFIRNAASALGISLAATLMSSPLTIHYFGVFSPGGIFLNLVMIPLAILVLTAGFISVLLNFLALTSLATIYNHAGWLILTLMEWTVRSGLAVPLFWEAAFPLPWVGPAALVLVLSVLLLCASRGWRAPFFHYAIPFLVFALVLSVAARLTFPGE